MKGEIVGSRPIGSVCNFLIKKRKEKGLSCHRLNFKKVACEWLEDHCLSMLSSGALGLPMSSFHF